MDLKIKIFNKIKKKSVATSIAIITAGLAGWFKFYAIPSSASTIIETVSESYGLDISAGNVTADLTDLKVNFEDVTWNVRGNYSSNELFKAKEISLDLNIIRYLSSGLDLSSALNEITIKGAKLHIEHKNSKRWNWQDAFNRKKIIRYVNREYNDESESNSNFKSINPGEPLQSNKDSSFSFSAIKFDDLRVVWIEELPSNSGSGLIKKLRSELFIEDVNLTAKNIIGIFQKDSEPMEIDFDGRTADGIIQASGEANIFSWGTPESDSGRNKEKLVWMPTLDLSLYLENIGAAALGQMIPDLSINATTGTMSGEVQIALNFEQIINYTGRLDL